MLLALFGFGLLAFDTPPSVVHTPPGAFAERNAMVQEALVRFRLYDESDTRTFSNADQLYRAGIRSSDARFAMPMFTAIGVSVFCTITMLIAHGPEAIRQLKIGPATLSDGAMGGGWALRF